jgi:hypothetical protein
VDAILLTYGPTRRSTPAAVDRSLRVAFTASGAVSTGHVWSPTADVRAAGERANVPYLYAGQTADGEQRTPFPATVAIHDVIVTAWPGVTSGGMRRDSARLAGVSHDPHRFGTAIDLMVRNDANRTANGDALANFLVRYAEYLQIQYVLWSNYEWSSSHVGARWEPYTGAESHEDHVHVEIGNTARGWSRDEMAARLRSALSAQAATRGALVPMGGGSGSSAARNAAMVGVGAAAAFGLAAALGAFKR